MSSHTWTSADQGDGNNILSPRKNTSQFEENNNEIDLLTQNLVKMGNITDKCNKKGMKLSSEAGDFNYRKTKEFLNKNGENQDANYVKTVEGANESKHSTAHNSFDYASDDFEEDSNSFQQNDIAVETLPQTNVKSVQEKDDITEKQTNHKSTKSDGSSCNKCRSFNSNGDKPSKPVEYDNDNQIDRGATSTTRSLSRSSICSGSTLRRQRKINMSFTNERSMEIERENSILLRKILRSQGSGTKQGNSLNVSRTSSATIIRKREQEKIHHENLILLRKIQKAKPSNLSLRR